MNESTSWTWGRSDNMKKTALLKVTYEKEMKSHLQLAPSMRSKSNKKNKHINQYNYDYDMMSPLSMSDGWVFENHYCTEYDNLSFGYKGIATNQAQRAVTCRPQQKRTTLLRYMNQHHQQENNSNDKKKKKNEDEDGTMNNDNDNDMNKLRITTTKTKHNLIKTINDQRSSKKHNHGPIHVKMVDGVRQGEGPFNRTYVYKGDQTLSSEQIGDHSKEFRGRISKKELKRFGGAVLASKRLPEGNQRKLSQLQIYIDEKETLMNKKLEMEKELEMLRQLKITNNDNNNNNNIKFNNDNVGRAQTSFGGSRNS